MVNIATAGNSMTACLQLLLDKGYVIQVWDEEESGLSSNSYYVARKDDNRYSAECPMTLLAMVTLGETWGEEWRDKGCGKNAWDRIEYDGPDLDISDSQLKPTGE